MWKYYEILHKVRLLVLQNVIQVITIRIIGGNEIESGQNLKLNV